MYRPEFVKVEVRMRDCVERSCACLELLAMTIVVDDGWVASRRNSLLRLCISIYVRRKFKLKYQCGVDEDIEDGDSQTL